MSGGMGGGDWVPRPDPTTRTKEAAELAAEVSRRELTAVVDQINVRLDAMDDAASLRLDLLREIRPQTERQIAHLRELHEVKFEAVDQRFEERDVRTEQAASAGKQALDAALQAAKELVGQQNKAATEAAAVMIANFTKLIDQQGLRLEALQKVTEARMQEIKERIDRGEGSQQGAAEFRTERRLDVGQAIMLAAVLVAVAGIIVAAMLRHG